MSLIQLHLEIIDTAIGILTQHHCKAQETGSNQMTITIAMIVTTLIFMIIIAALTLTMKFLQRDGNTEAPSGISYRVS
jgi:high-affinity K+ transport system ATPase subunit B